MAVRSDDIRVVAESLSKAKLSLDAAVDHVLKRNPDIARTIAQRLHALDDNNTTCNTACTCGVPVGIQDVKSAS
jgi:hypothetical protein